MVARGAAAALVLLMFSAPVRAQAVAPGDLVGTWDIRVNGGTADGDLGVIEIVEGAAGLEAYMSFTDTSAGVTATERCRVEIADPQISVICEVLTPDRSTYAPDDFDLRLTFPNRMEGRMLSLTTGAAVLTRRIVPMS